MSNVFFDRMDTVNGIFAIAKYLSESLIKPDQLVGISRGGLVPAVMLSHYIKTPLLVLNKNSHDNSIYFSEYVIKKGTIVVVDEINDTGKTFKELDKGFKMYVPNTKIIYVTLVNNLSSEFKSDFSYKNIDKSVDDSWIIFWWEEWWKSYF